MATRRRPARTHRRRGRPLVHKEAWSKVSVVLFDRQVVGLDRIVDDVRHKTGKALNRAGIIRALIDGLLDSGWDISSMPAESELRIRIAKCLRRRS